MRRIAAWLAASTVTVAAALGWTAASALADAAPCPNGSTLPWCNRSLSPEQRADVLLAALTVQDKENIVAGNSVSDPDVPAADLQNYVDGPVGAPAQVPGSSRPATALPSASALGATFDHSAAALYGNIIGTDAKSYGYYGTYGPTLNILRTPFAGRGEEYYGEDPFLVSQTGAEVVKAEQATGVSAQVKHFVGNDQEGQIGVTPGWAAVGGRKTVNVNADDRTLHEVYLAPFEAAIVQAHARSVMCSYNHLNGPWTCEDPWLLQTVLRKQWGFQGWIGPDLLANHNANNDWTAGVDQPYYAPQAVDLALQAGAFTQQQLDDHVRHLLWTLFDSGIMDNQPRTDTHQSVDWVGQENQAAQIEEQGMVLLRNQHRILPIDLHKVHTIAVIGPAANQYIRASGSMQVTPNQTPVTLLQGIQQRVGSAATVVTDDGSNPVQAATVAAGADVVILAVNDQETEGADKPCISLSCPVLGLPNGTQPETQDPRQDALIQQVAAANPNTVIVLQTGEPILTPWRDSVRGLLEAWYPGEAGGTAIAHVLFGDVDPGGRLPSTFPADANSGYATSLTRDPTEYPGTTDEYYKEGIFVGYRWYDAHHLQVAYPFGFGLSYTTFAYSHLQIHGHSVSLTVTNTGDRTGTAVPEVYLGLPSTAAIPEPPEQLAGFDKLSLEPGQHATVTIPLPERSFQYWNTQEAGWAVMPGCVKVMTGSSSASRALPLTGVIAQGGARCTAPPTRPSR